MFRQLRKRNRWTMIIWFVFVLPKTLNMQHCPFFEGNKWSNPRGASVIGVVHFHAFFVFELGQAICYFWFLHTNPKSIMAFLESFKVRNNKILNYYNTIMGWGVQIFKWGYLARNLNLNYYNPNGIYKLYNCTIIK